MYAIICWEDDNKVKPLLNPDGTLKLFDSLDEADGSASALEGANKGFEARVISIEGVSE